MQVTQNESNNMQTVTSTNNVIAALDDLIATADKLSAKRQEAIAKTESIIAMLDGKFPAKAKKQRFAKLALACKRMFKRNA